MTEGQSSASAQEHEDLTEIIKIDEAKVSSHLSDPVHKTVQDQELATADNAAA